MDKKTKTALIVALSVFSVGVIICLCVAMSVHFDFTKLAADFRSNASNAASTNTEHIQKDIEATGQSIILDLSSAYVTVTPSNDDMIHLSYDNSDNCTFELKDESSQLSLTQENDSGFFFGFFNIQNTHPTVTLSIPVGHEGTLNINGASSQISISKVEISGDFEIYSVSDKIIIENCKAKTVKVGNTSGSIELNSIETSKLRAETVSGALNVSEISQGVPLTLRSTSGEISAENVDAENVVIDTVSGGIDIKNITGLKAELSTTSGETNLISADFKQINFNAVSGGIHGTVSGSAEDYTVYIDTVSGSNNISSDKGRGDRTLNLSSVSGNFDISFEK